jgi:hypothetical protein
MTQDLKDTKPETAKELDTAQVQGVGGGADVCTIEEGISQLQQAYDTLVDTASYVMERVATAYKAL